MWVHDPRPMPMTCSNPTLEKHAFLITRWDGEPVNAAPIASYRHVTEGEDHE